MFTAIVYTKLNGEPTFENLYLCPVLCAINCMGVSRAVDNCVGVSYMGVTRALRSRHAAFPPLVTTAGVCIGPIAAPGVCIGPIDDVAVRHEGPSVSLVREPPPPPILKSTCPTRALSCERLSCRFWCVRRRSPVHPQQLCAVGCASCVVQRRVRCARCGPARD